MYSCLTCGDTFCDGCGPEEPEEERDPALTTLEALEPIHEGMTLEEWEEREALQARVYWQAIREWAKKEQESLKRRKVA